MKKRWPFMLWLVWNGGTLALVVAGVIRENEKCANMARFSIWLAFVVYLLAIWSDDAGAAIREAGRAVNLEAAFVFDVLLGFALAAHGWFGYASLVVMTGVFSYAIFKQEPPINPVYMLLLPNLMKSREGDRITKAVDEERTRCIRIADDVRQRIHPDDNHRHAFGVCPRSTDALEIITRIQRS